MGLAAPLTPHPACHRQQQQEQEPQHQRAPDEADRALHVVDISLVAHTQFGAVVNAAVLVERVAQPHAEGARAARQDDALGGLKP